MIIIADNQPLTHDALVSYLANQPLCFAANKQQLAEKLEQSVDAVVVIDFSLFNFTTPEQMLIYLRRFAQARWLMLSAEFAPNLVHLLGAEPQVSFLTRIAHVTTCCKLCINYSKASAWCVQSWPTCCILFRQPTLTMYTSLPPRFQYFSS